jgi:hypothetical protein
MARSPAEVCARLETLRDRFDTAANEYPHLEAVVVFAPDVGCEDVIRQFVDASCGPDADTYERARMRVEAKRVAARLQFERWVPPWNKTVQQLGGHVYWSHQIEHLPAEGPLRVIWRCTLFGPPTGARTPTALRLFQVLAPVGGSHDRLGRQTGRG